MFSDRRRGLAFSLLGALCSALYLFPYKRAAEFAPADVLAFALLVVAALLSSGVSWFERRSAPSAVPVAGRLLWAPAVLLSVLTVTGNYCGAQAVSRLDPAINSLLLRTEVVFVGVLGTLFLGEAVSGRLALGAGTALAGLCVMRWPLSLEGAGRGVPWSLGAAASFGSMQVITRRVIQRISPASVNSLRLWIAVAALACVPQLLPRALGAGALFWSYVAAAGFFGPFAGRLSIMYSLRGLRAAESALLLLLAPLFAFLIGYLGWGTLPSGRESAGAGLMLLGIALPQLGALAWF